MPEETPATGQTQPIVTGSETQVVNPETGDTTNVRTGSVVYPPTEIINDDGTTTTIGGSLTARDVDGETTVTAEGTAILVDPSLGGARVEATGTATQSGDGSPVVGGTIEATYPLENGGLFVNGSFVSNGPDNAGAGIRYENIIDPNNSLTGQLGIDSTGAVEAAAQATA